MEHGPHIICSWPHACCHPAPQHTCLWASRCRELCGGSGDPCPLPALFLLPGNQLTAISTWQIPHQTSSLSTRPSRETLLTLSRRMKYSLKCSSAFSLQHTQLSVTGLSPCLHLSVCSTELGVPAQCLHIATFNRNLLDWTVLLGTFGWVCLPEAKFRSWVLGRKNDSPSEHPSQGIICARPAFIWINEPILSGKALTWNE